MKIVGNISKIGANTRPLALIARVPEMSAAGGGNAVRPAGGALFEDRALRREPSSPWPRPRAGHWRAALGELEGRVPRRAARRRDGHLGLRRRQLLDRRQHQVRER